MGAGLWRVPTPNVSFGSAHSVIQDNGVLTGAVPSTLTQNYLFSEHGAGVKPLALIGRQHEISEWLTIHDHKAIENRISAMPDIYMDMCYYTPGQRYKGLFPLHDAATQAAHGAVAMGGAMVPGGGSVIGSMFADMAGAISDGIGIIRDLFSNRTPKQPPMPCPRTHRVYILFTYYSEIKGKPLLKLGSGTVTFRQMQQTLIQAMKMI